VGVEAAIFAAAGALPNAGWGRLAIVYLTGALVIAVIAKILLGCFAHERDE